MANPNRITSVTSKCSIKQGNMPHLIKELAMRLKGRGCHATVAKVISGHYQGSRSMANPNRITSVTSKCSIKQGNMPHLIKELAMRLKGRGCHATVAKVIHKC